MKAFVSLDAGSTKVCKVTSFQQLVHSGIYDVICVCATSLSDSIMDSELVSGYCIFRKDRVDRVGGGIVVAPKPKIRTTRHQDLEKKDLELVVIELIQPNSKPVLPYTFYRPPD